MAGQGEQSGHDYGSDGGGYGIGPVDADTAGGGAGSARVVLGSARIIVGYLPITVIFDKARIDAASVDGGRTLDGQFREGEQTILLRPEYGPDKTREVFLHEVLHAISVVSGLDSRLTDEQEEDVVRSMAPLLLDVLRRNPDVVTYLTDDS